MAWRILAPIIVDQSTGICNDRAAILTVLDKPLDKDDLSWIAIP